MIQHTIFFLISTIQKKKKMQLYFDAAVQIASTALHVIQHYV